MSLDKKTPGRIGNYCRRGFSLTELAIVVGIIGMLVSGIWSYAASTRDNTRRQQLAQQILTVVKNTRALYLGQSSICGTFDQLTSQLASTDALPGTMIRTQNCTNAGPPAGMCADTPWMPAANKANGSFAVGAGPYCVATGTCGTSTFAAPCLAANSQILFTVELRNVAYENCVFLVPQNSGPLGPAGLADVVINGTDIMTSGTTSHSFPVQVNDAQALCTAASTIDFVYKLRDSTI